MWYVKYILIKLLKSGLISYFRRSNFKKLIGLLFLKKVCYYERVYSAWEVRTETVIHAKCELTHPKRRTVSYSQLEVRAIPHGFLPYCLCAID